MLRPYLPIAGLAAVALLALLAAAGPAAADALPPANVTLAGEPTYTNGTSNTLFWSAGSDNDPPIEYEVQASRAINFATVEATSSWISNTNFTFTGLQDGILYYYRVRARDSVGNTGGFSALEFSTQDASAPSVPIMAVEPAFTAGTFNTVAWGASADAGVGGVQYQVEVSTSSVFSGIFATSAWGAGTSASFFSLTDGTTYYYHVKSRDSFGHVSAWSQAVSSTQDNSAPTVPVLSAEPTFTAGTSNQVSWSTSTDSGVGGVQYLVQHSTSSTFAGGVVSSPWLSTTSQNVTPLSSGVTYFYRVFARDGLGLVSSASAILSSTQDNAAPTTPGLGALPTYTAGTTITVSWSASTDAISGGVAYLIEQSRNSGFTTLEDTSGWVSSTSFTFTKLDDSVQYFYRVKARDAVLNEGAYSATRSSTQDNAPPTVPVVSPEPAFTAGTSNVLVWGASSDAGSGSVTYLTQRSSSSTFSTVDATFGWSSSLFSFFTGLSDGATYYYRVKARDALGMESAFTSVLSSTQDNSGPSAPAITPEPAFTAGTANTITWSTSVDAGVGGVTYQAQRATNAAFTAGLVSSGWSAQTTITFTALANGVTYFYRAQARDSFLFTSAFSSTVSSRQDSAPPPVPVLAAEPTFTPGSTNMLAWGAVTDAGSGGVTYWVESSRQGTFTTIDDASGWIASTSHTFTRLDDGATYFYRVRAQDALGQVSGNSAARSSTQDASAPPVPAMLPLPAIAGGTAIAVGWGAVTDATSGGVRYFAEYSATPTFSTVLGNSGWISGRSWVLTGLTNGVTYYFHVKARDALTLESAFSQSVSTRMDSAAPTAPTMAAEPSFTPGTWNVVSWSVSTDAGIGGVVYDLQRATNAAFTGATTFFSISQATFNATSLADGTTYYYRVRARDAFGFSTAFSAGVSSRQDNSPPTAPAMNAEPAFTAGTSNTVAWSASADAGVGGVTYNVQVSRTPTFATLETESGWVDATSFAFTRLDDGGTFYYRVATRDAFIFQTAYSSSVSSTQDNAAPTVPVLSPLPAYTPGTTQALVWGAASDAGVGGVEYQYRYSADATFGPPVTLSAWVSGTSATAAGLSDGVAYFFQVRARDLFGFTSAWSQTASSTQDASPPTVPAMTAEPSHSQGTLNTVSWTGSADAGVGGVQYLAQVSASSTFATVLGDSGWVSSTQATFFGLTDGVRYYFRAKSRDSFGQESAFSSSVNSVQDASPPAVPATSPMSSYTTGASRTFSWSASTDAGVGGVTYEAQLGSNPGFFPVLSSSAWAAGTSATFSGLSDATTYYFRVRARDAFLQTSAFSTTRSTTMDASPPTVPVLVPEPTFTSGTVNAITWGASVDAGVGSVAYQVQYSTSPVFAPAQTVTSGWGVSTPYTILGLLDGQTYYYRVRARDAFLLTTAFSSVERSTQDASPPSIPVPITLPPVIDGGSTLFEWLPAADAGVGGVEYRARVSDDPTFASVLETSPWSPLRSYLFTGLSDATLYFYQVQSRDTFGYMSQWSTADFALTDILPPGVPTPDAMPSFSRGLSVNFTWRDSFDAGIGGVQYQAGAFLAADPSAPFVLSPWSNRTRATIGGLPEGQTIYFAVRAQDLLGHTSAFSTFVWTVPDNSPPPVPTLTPMAPFVAGQSFTAAWGGVVDAGVGGVLYRAQASADPTFSLGVIDSGWVDQTTHTFGGLADGATYFVRVKAQDAFSFESAWSSAGRTTMDASGPSATTAAELPAFTDGTTVAVRWSVSFDLGVGGVTYRVDVSTNASFATLVNQSPWTGASGWTFEGLADGTRFYFRVAARDAFLYLSGYSNYIFTTPDASPPTVPVLLALDEYSSGLQRKVEWAPSADLGVAGVEYLVESSANASFPGGAVTSGWISATSFTFAGLAEGVETFYRAKGRDAFGHESGWSLVVSTTQDNAAPTVLPDFTGYLVDSADVLLTGTAFDGVSGVAAVLYSTNGGVDWIPANGTSNWQAPVTGLPEGNWAVLVKSRDGVGWESAAWRVDIAVDTSAPLVAFQSPTNGSVLAGLVGVYAILSDPHFATYTLERRAAGDENFTGIAVNRTLTRGDNFLALWDTRALDNGLLELRLTAVDALGHSTQRAIEVRLLNSDLAVTYNDLQVSDRAPVRGDRVNVTAVVTNFGSARAQDVTVRIKDNGVVIFEDAGVTVDPHTAYTAIVDYAVNRSGAHTFALEVEYPEGALDEGLSTSTVVMASDPPVPEPEPFLIEYAGLFSLASLVALVALAAFGGWSVVQIRRLKASGPGGRVVYAPEAYDQVDVEWESDEMF